MLSLTLTIHSILLSCAYFLLLLTYMMVSFMTVQEDFIGVFFTPKQPEQSELQNEQNSFFQVDFLCSVTLNLTFTFKYVILLPLAFVS